MVPAGPCAPLVFSESYLAQGIILLSDILTEPSSTLSMQSAYQHAFVSTYRKLGYTTGDNQLTVVDKFQVACDLLIPMIYNCYSIATISFLIDVAMQLGLLAIHGINIITNFSNFSALV